MASSKTSWMFLSGAVQTYAGYMQIFVVDVTHLKTHTPLDTLVGIKILEFDLWTSIAKLVGQEVEYMVE